ncbi:flagellar motor protein MotB [Luteimonas sp. 3794]|uniref:flagellar motor protein MotB n=1 Tax=Luteimonas sp. 3794 TaxID=2817730 RepID=UPI0028544789|nr:flagellar motor protein MotB [Luteimonas sp. 3794]MDR6990695.1 chemotaxis protein MotB [Luteimonas sp. 3794]
MSEALQPIIIVRKKKRGGGGHHGGAWKVAYADFVTAMMAFFMVMWLVATMPQEQLGGISEYFKNPSAVSGRATVMAAGSNGPGGAGNVPIKMFDHLRNPPGAGPDAKVGEGSDASERARDAADQERLEALQRALEKAVASSQALAPFKDQLLIDITPEGLRIQIVDTHNRPMFDLGSPNLKDYTSQILVELATYLNQVENRVAISGHTDNTPYSGATGQSNWELSTQRANAARRALVAGGLEEGKLSRIVGLSSSVPFDKTDEANPINRRISIVVLNNAAERTAARVDDALEPDESSAPASGTSAPASTPETAAPAPGTAADAG